MLHPRASKQQILHGQYQAYKLDRTNKYLVAPIVTKDPVVMTTVEYREHFSKYLGQALLRTPGIPLGFQEEDRNSAIHFRPVTIDFNGE
jgi:hypothetical protein